MATASAYSETSGQPPNNLLQQIEALPLEALAKRVPDGLLLAHWMIESSSMRANVAQKLCEFPFLETLRDKQLLSIGQHFGDTKPEDNDLALLGCEAAISALRHPDLESILRDPDIGDLGTAFFEAQKIVTNNTTRKGGQIVMARECVQLGLLGSALNEAEQELTGEAEAYLASPFEKGFRPVLFTVALQAGVLPPYEQLQELTV